MSQSEVYWFHCGQCGSLFQEGMDRSEDRVCPHCGMHPAPSADASQVVEAAAQAAFAAPVAVADTPSKPYHQRAHKKSFTGLKIIGAWLVLIGLIVGGARLMSGGDPVSETTEYEASPAIDSEEPLSEEEVFMQEAIPQCLEKLKACLQAPSAKEQMPYLMSSGLDEAAIQAFNNDNPLSEIDASTIKLKASSKLQLEDKVALMVQWETADGDLFDTVFVEEDGSWKLDWQHFVRYGDEPWSMFLAGSGNDEGEFRVLARERYPEKRKVSDKIEVMFYAPRYGHMDEAGFKATIEPVLLSSHAGKMLCAGFDHALGGGDFFGSTIKRINPQDMIRVRVKMKRFSGDGRVHYRITDVVACHWLNTDQQFVELKDAPAEEEAGD